MRRVGRYQINCIYEAQDEPFYGLIIQEAEHQFLVAGVNLRLEFCSTDKSQIGQIGMVHEVFRDGDVWRTLRVLNGDETFHHSSLRVLGREHRIGAASRAEGLGPQPTAEQPLVAETLAPKHIKTPGVYRVQTNRRPR
jgi:hypothetical protein